MEKLKNNNSKLIVQEADPEVLEHICALAAEHNADLSRWCARQRRRDAFRRVAVATCFLAVFAFVADIAYARPLQYTEKFISGDISSEEASNIIFNMLNNI